MSSLLRGVGAVIGAGGIGTAYYRYHRRITHQREKEEEPSLMDTQEKFSHFASVDGTLMTTEDFVRSFSAGSGGVSTKAEEKHSAAYSSLESLFRQIDADGDAFVSYPEYCMFATLVSLPRDQFRVAFKMFDVNENEKIEMDDFKHMMQALVVDPSVKLNFKGGICETFFGKNYDRSLTFEKFSSLVNDLRREIRTAEFKSYEAQQKGVISFPDLQSLFGLPRDTSSTAGREEGSPSSRVSLQEYHNLVNVLLDTDTIGRAMQIYDEGFPDDQGCNKAEFVRALRCADVRLSPHEVDLFFALFDTDRSGRIDADEFKAIAGRKRSFFSSSLPRFDQPKRNAIQEWAFCMQQKQ